MVRDLETGEIDAVSALDAVSPASGRANAGTGSGVGADDVPMVNSALGAEQGVGERQVDQQRVGAEDQGGGAQAPIATDRG